MSPVICLSPLAAAKEHVLRENFTTMVGWHGVVRREGDIFVVEDVMVYPQDSDVLTTVVCEKELSAWYDAFPNEDFLRLRYHGSSYGTMPPVPSRVDLNFEKDIARMLNDGDFYIFGIVNDEGSRNMRIRTSETRHEDVAVIVEFGAVGDLTEFLDDAKRKIRVVKK